MKKTLLCFFLFFLLMPIVTFAQSGGETEDINNLDIEIIADTNIRNAFVANLDRNLFSIGFDVVNEWDKAQSGVKYALELYRPTQDGDRYLVDKVVFDEVLSLASQQNIHREVLYNIPQSLPGNEKYEMQIVLSNSDGMILAILDAGQLSKEGQSGIFIDPLQCYVQIGDEKYDPLQGVDLRQEEELKIVCDNVVNYDNTEKKSSVHLITKKRTSFGDIVEQKSFAQESFRANEKKNISYVVEKITAPQAYEGRFSLRSDGIEISNSIIIRYVMQGETATIQNVTADKDYYTKGDVAKISVFVSGKASAFPGARDMQNVQDLTDVEELILVTNIKNNESVNCVGEYTKKLSGFGENIQAEIPVTTTCRDPKIFVQARNHEGTILDEAEFLIQTVSKNADDTERRDFSAFFIQIIKWLIVIIPFIVLIGYVAHKRLTGSKTGLSLFLGFLLVCGGVFGLHAKFVDAASFTTGNYHCFTLDGVKGYCVVNGTYDVTPGTNCSDTKASASMQWSACSNITVDAHLYINGSDVWHSTSKDSDYAKTVWVSKDSKTKTKNLGKLSVGNHKIPFKMTFYHDWHDWNFNRKTEVIEASKTVYVPSGASNGVCGTRHQKVGEWADLSAYTLCSSGTYEWVGGLDQPTIGRWEWKCKGECGGTTANCWAEPPTAVDGACNSTTVGDYAWDATGFRGALCSSGTPNPVNVIFPGYGETVAWGCNGSNGGMSTSATACVARRGTPPPVNGECDSTATGDYAWDATGFRGALCLNGTTPVLPADFAFPAVGSSVTWGCAGLFNGTSTNSDACFARRNNPSIACGTASGTTEYNSGPPTTNLCPSDGSVVAPDHSTTPPIPRFVNGQWQWACQHNTITSIFSDMCSAPTCITGRPITATTPVIINRDNDQHTVVSVSCPNLCCEVVREGTTIPVTICSNSGTNSAEIQIPAGGANLTSMCWFDDGDGNPGDPGDTPKTPGNTVAVQTACTARSCNAQHTCQATAQIADSLDDCSSTCNSDADCSSGRMIETRP